MRWAFSPKQRPGTAHGGRARVVRDVTLALGGGGEDQLLELLSRAWRISCTVWRGLLRGALTEEVVIVARINQQGFVESISTYRVLRRGYALCYTCLHRVALII
jgi:hypothetical protein